ncbi:facilitated trehalose transporter Tret1-2 homolog [Drosophila montana]|uniref:facilitated trehalose transporter Tret1-2 homolog n=1 Tax=Drosophila montana TaxID=40370 RepID=UPI00313EFA9D
MAEDSQMSVISLTQFLAAIAVGLCSFCVGFTNGYTSPALPLMEDRSKTDFEVTKQAASWIGGIMPLAGLVGGVCGGPLIVYVGRRLTILLTAVPFILAWLLIGFATSVWFVLTGRLIAGLAVGVSSLALPVYLGEALHPLVRGTLGLMPTLLGNFGLVAVYTFGTFITWSQLAFVGAGCCLPFLILMLFVPESPRWYLSRDKQEKAQKSLQWLRRKNADVNAELQGMAAAKSEDSQNIKETCRELCSKKNRRPILISLFLMLFQQFSGINAVIFYTVKIFTDAGSTIDSNLSTIIVGLVNFAATLIATLIIDRVGRKILLYISAVAMILTLFLLAAFFFCKYKGMKTSDYGWIPLMCCVVYVMGFSVGFGPIPWLMMGEILPARIRGLAASIVVGFNWTCAFIVTKTFQDMIDSIGSHGAFGVFGSVCILALLFVIFFVPETKNKTLEEIEAELTA